MTVRASSGSHLSPPAAPVASYAAFTIGRSGANDLTLQSPLVSAVHCRVEARPEGHAVVDLGSFTGTYVNGRPVHDTVLHDGDRLAVGDATFTLEFGRLIPRSATRSGLDVAGLAYTLPNGTRLLGPITLRIAPSTLTAVIGPSGAGKTTLFRLLTGVTRPTAGQVRCAGVDVHSHPAYFRSRIGVVPQDDVLHRQLRVARSLAYAASLRFPPDLEPERLHHCVMTALAELQLGEHADAQISRLSGGQRKRTSVAMELLTAPELLFLDEPTSGLDPALDKSVMTTLRGLANGGRTVVVITHAVANLEVCDNVLVLAPGGLPVFFGNPGDVATHFGTGDYAEIFEQITRHADIHVARFPSTPPVGAAPDGAAPVRAAPDGAAPVGAETAGGASVAPRPPIRHQVRTLARRQLDVMLADRSSLIFNSTLPVALGVLSWTVPGSFGLAAPAGPSSEAMQMLVILVIGAVFMGMSGTVRDLVAERQIYLRERAVGLAPAAYLAAKVAVFSMFASVQTLVLLIVVALRKPMPDRSVLLHAGTLELWLALTLIAISGVALGLLISALATSSEQVMPLLVVLVMTQLVLCGGLIPVAGRVGLSQLALLAPARWGYAMAATSVGVLDALGTPREDALWEPFATTWIFTVLMLSLLTLGLLTLTLRRLERP